MAISAEDLTELLVGRVPEVPRKALEAMALAVVEMCDEARADEREACAQMVDRLAEESRIAAENFSAIDEPCHAERHVNYRDRAMAIAVAIRERN